MSIKISGLDEIEKFLDETVPGKATNLLRATIQGIAGDIAKGARKNAPVGKTGSLKKGFKAKRRKMVRGKPRSDVIGAPHWHLVEYGTSGREHKSGKSTGSVAERPMVRPEIDRVNASMDSILEEQLKKKLRATLKREKKKTAKL